MTTAQIIEALATTGHMIQIELIDDGEYLVSMEAPPSSDYLEPYDGSNIDDIFQQIRAEILRP